MHCDRHWGVSWKKKEEREGREERVRRKRR